ncbi:MAG: hypothetical protein N2487_02960 [Verrucomicrobiae bacterium]|nr:hypothetical protein [Verrucomicrobiae bacterium]
MRKNASSITYYILGYFRISTATNRFLSEFRQNQPDFVVGKIFLKSGVQKQISLRLVLQSDSFTTNDKTHFLPRKACTNPVLQ